MDKTVGPQEIARRQALLQELAASGTAVTAEHTQSGPAAIESARDAGAVVPELIRLTPLAEQRGFDALIIGCFSDPGIDALRELLTIPVVGPGAASSTSPPGRARSGIAALLASSRAVGFAGARRPRQGGGRRAPRGRRGRCRRWRFCRACARP